MAGSKHYTGNERAETQNRIKRPRGEPLCTDLQVQAFLKVTEQHAVNDGQLVRVRLHVHQLRVVLVLGKPLLCCNDGKSERKKKEEEKEEEKKKEGWKSLRERERERERERSGKHNNLRYCAFSRSEFVLSPSPSIVALIFFFFVVVVVVVYLFVFKKQKTNTHCGRFFVVGSGG